MYNSVESTIESLGDISAVSPRFTWTFDICCQERKNVGEYVESPSYLTAIGNRIIQWCLRLYEEGEDDACKGYCSLYLCASESFTAIVSFEIVNMSEASNYRKERYVLNQESCGFRKFILISSLKEQDDNELLINNKITILCGLTLLNYGVPGVMYHLTILDGGLESVEEAPTAAPEASVVERFVDIITPIQFSEIDKFKALINDEKYSDLEIRANGNMIKVHKCIIERSSKIVKALLELDRSRTFVDIDDVHPDALTQSIVFAYTGKIEDVEKVKTMASELLKAAEKLGMDGMKNMCEKLMCQNLRQDNAISYLELAETFRLNELRVKARILCSLKDIVSEPRFRELACAVYYCLTHPRQ